MRKLLRYLLPVVVSTLLAWIVPSELPRAVPDPVGLPLIDLLPESTVAAVEIRDLSRRWDEIRGLPAIARFQDRVLGAWGFAADDLPLLAGNRAVLALVASEDGRRLVPIALLRPSRLAEAETLLERRIDDANNEAPFVVRHGLDTLWLLPADATDRPDLVPVRRSSLSSDVGLHELEQRLPEGGLARGWIDPRALREFLLRSGEGGRPAVVEWAASLGAVELEAVRLVGFRRDLTSAGVETDAVVAYDTDLLPFEVAHVLRSRPEAARLPETLPPGVLAMAAFRPESEASLAWLRHVAMRDPRGPLRNLEFWLEAFEERSGRNVERDLRDAIGDRGWMIAFEKGPRETTGVAVVLETVDGPRVAKTLLDLRAFLMDHLLGRSLGLVVPRARDARFGDHELHGVTLGSPFGSAEGPVFTVTEQHVVLATEDRALEQALRLLADRSSWSAVMRDIGLPYPAHEAVRVRLAALDPLIDVLFGPHCVTGGTDLLADAVRELAALLDTATLGIWFEDDALRLHGHVRLAAG